MPNRLSRSTSPYLLQHRDNPVDWHPWSAEAHARARAEDKPILVSIGYSACHWCHVMAHECFESSAIAAQMNANFINIKVDREERPDLDGIYMSAVQAITGQGGWPLNVFLTPDLVPFFGGTYWPPRAGRGMPSFPEVLASVHEAWMDRREAVTTNAAKLLNHLSSNSATLGASDETVTGRDLDDATNRLWETFDHDQGGFGAAPKFPQAPVLGFLLAHAQRTGSERATTMVTRTLDAMAEGGMYDQVGGGFARYSVDRTWTVPHFEKMLYDNAQLLRLYTDAHRLLGTDRYRELGIATGDWMIRELESADGGFASALDADSDGREGAFYVWTPAQIDEVHSPEDADLARLAFGISDQGNFEGESIPVMARTTADLAVSMGLSPKTVNQRLDQIRTQLLAARETRPRPATDTKRIVGWNGLAIDALAHAGWAWQAPRFIEAAIRAANACWSIARLPDGTLSRLIDPGTDAVTAMLEDYAFLARGYLSLYEVTADLTWLDRAAELRENIDAVFVDPDGPGWFDVEATREGLIYRPRELQDGATPSGNAVACEVASILAHYRGEAVPASVTGLLSALWPAASRHPTAFGRYLAVAERLAGEPRLVVLHGETDSPLAQVMATRFEPSIDVAYRLGNSDKWPFFTAGPVPASDTAFVCTGTACLAPVSEPGALVALLNRD